jgi:hypothetical protein
MITFFEMMTYRSNEGIDPLIPENEASSKK